MVAYKSRTFLLSILLIIVLFFAIHKCIFRVSGVVESVASTLVYPVLKVQNSIASTVKKISTMYTKKRALHDQIKFLKEQNESLIAENITILSSQLFFDNTKELVRFKERYDVSKASLAHIIMKQFTSYEHSFLVDCGTVHGIEVDMVAVYKNCLVGRVEQVYPYYSKVRLISDSACKVAAYCRLSHARGIHEGCNDHYSSLQFVSHLAQLKPNDIIISSGEGLIFPQGFGIGRIDSFESDGLYYKIRVKPLLKLDELDYCYLIKKK